MVRNKRAMAVALVLALLWLLVMGSVYHMVQTHTETVCGPGTETCSGQQSAPLLPTQSIVLSEQATGHTAPAPPHWLPGSTGRIGGTGQREAEYLVAIGEIDHRSPATRINRNSA
jgi:hypothetical protein